jgi:hypothetical protein
LKDSSVTVTLANASGKSIKTQTIKLNDNGEAEVEWDFTVGDDVELWWPVGQGKHPLYDVSAELSLQVRLQESTASLSRRLKRSLFVAGWNVDLQEKRQDRFQDDQGRSGESHRRAWKQLPLRSQRSKGVLWR